MPVIIVERTVIVAPSNAKDVSGCRHVNDDAAVPTYRNDDD